MRTKIRVKITIKLFLNGKLVVRATRRIKDRILKIAKVTMWQKGLLIVSYGPSPKEQNAGCFYNFQELKEILSVFTEKSLLDYLKGEKNGSRI